MRKKYRFRAKKKIKAETKRVRKTRALPEVAESTTMKLQMLSNLLSQLFTDENFVTLLEAESLTAIPAVLRPVLEEARSRSETRYEID